MSTFLFKQIVYGPVRSRRLGVSLGINLSPANGKRCTFDCIYCECGLNKDRIASLPAPSREEVRKALVCKLEQLTKKELYPDSLTFSGNGEPTMHPDFVGIIDDTLALRNRFSPFTKVAVLTNSTMLHKTEVFQTLHRVDETLMKLDAATDELIALIDQPVIHDFTAHKLIEQLTHFDGNLTIQSMFLKGEHHGITIDNTREKEVDLWVEALKKIHPQKVMIYTLKRETPVKSLQKIPLELLEAIAEKVRKAGINEIVVSG